MDKLSNYYLIKCFSTREHLDDFINAKCFYVSSANSFWQMDNDFQQDKELEIFSTNRKGYLLAGNDNLQNTILSSHSVNEILEKMGSNGILIGNTDMFNSYIDGYISCYYIIHKNAITIENSVFTITEKNEYDNFQFFLQKYLEKKTTAYVAVFDAFLLCNLLKSQMNKKGYICYHKKVEYKDLNEEQRIKLFQEHNYCDIVFTKSNKYNYQREFRMYFYKPQEPIQNAIKVSDINVSNSFITSFVAKKDN